MLEIVNDHVYVPLEESSSNAQPPEYAYLLCVEVYQEHLGSVLLMHIYKVELPRSLSNDLFLQETYRLWRESFGMYPWPLVKRVKRCWDRLKNWLSANFPEADATLRKGATEVEIEALENILKVKLPLPTRLLYRFCDGQELTDDVGGTALGSNLGNKGDYRPARSLVSAGEMIPCVPNALLSPMHDSNTGQQQDAMLLWLEEHVRRLQNGIIKLRKEGMIRSINLFPEESPLCSTAVTNGVQVRASAVFIPEGCNLLDESHKYLFAYSIRMRLLPEGCIVNGTSFGSCQLNWRHWIIRANDHVVSDVNGEAVIGKVSFCSIN
ncbi:F-box protein SKIP16 [Vitis vinifera]|uniref:F-box protein SKIP16 n=1 Tax=Vitis vinifera TaxID=29760 RepID=A0A438I5G3_VITVI|nr:F-box protein SKIP16 [Vitis vinifera]